MVRYGAIQMEPFERISGVVRSAKMISGNKDALHKSGSITCRLCFCSQARGKRLEGKTHKRVTPFGDMLNQRN